MSEAFGNGLGEGEVLAAAAPDTTELNYTPDAMDAGMGEKIEAESRTDILDLAQAARLLAVKLDARRGFNHPTSGKLAEAERQLAEVAATLDRIAEGFAA